MSSGFGFRIVPIPKVLAVLRKHKLSVPQYRRVMETARNRSDWTSGQLLLFFFFLGSRSGVVKCCATPQKQAGVFCALFRLMRRALCIREEVHCERHPTHNTAKGDRFSDDPFVCFFTSVACCVGVRQCAAVSAASLFAKKVRCKVLLPAPRAGKWIAAVLLNCCGAWPYIVLSCL